MHFLSCKAIKKKFPLGKTYVIKVDGGGDIQKESIIVAFLYINYDYYTLTWTGHLDFSILEKTALNVLSHDASDHDNYQVDAYIAVEDKNPRVIKYKFGGKKNRRDYKNASQRFFEKICFARYDVKNKGCFPKINYSFTAEKKNHSMNKFAELGIKLPKEQQITTAILYWILQNHHNQEILSGQIDIEESLRNINKYL